MRFNTYTLKELATIRYGKNQSTVSDPHGSVPIYGTGGLMGYANRCLFDKPSVLIGRKGTIGKVKYVDHPFWTVDTLFYTEINQSIVLPKFLYFVMSQVDLNLYNEGTTIPSLRTETLNRLEFNIPSIKEQKQILSILNPIDEKVAINSAINDNLQQQIQLLFSDFLRSPIPFTENTVGSVVVTANTGADAIQRAPIVDYDTGVRCIRVGDMTNHHPFNEWGFAKVSADDFSKYQLHKNDILITRTAVLGLNCFIFNDLPAVYNNGLIRISIDPNKLLPLFLFMQFQSKDFEQYIGRIESETSVRPNMKINYLLNYAFKMPTLSEQQRIVKTVYPLFEKKNALIDEIVRLAQLRSTLLPKLMNGEIDVSAVEI